MAALLGLLVAVSYGAADFFGGLGTKRAPVAAVVVLSHVCGLPALTLLLVLTGGSHPPKVLVLGAAAGAFVAIGLVCLYQGLATGRMSVVAPITAVGAAVVPLAWGLLRGERPAPLALLGVVLAIVAVVLISRTPDELAVAPPEHGPPVLVLAVIAGVAFGTVFILLAETGKDAGFWPLVTERATSITVLCLGSLLTGRSLRPVTRPALAIIATSGAFDLAANAVYLLAARRGLLSLVAVLASLYPASTVVLARLVLHERLHRLQLAGLGLAAAGVVLIATG